MTQFQMPQQADVAAFHEAFGHPVADAPTLVSPEIGLLRVKLIAEELAEYEQALVDDDLVGIADALGDLLYVVLGAAVVHGIDLAEIHEEIQRSNMSKLGEDGKPVPHPTIPNKIGKGPNYTPPQLGRVVRAQQARASV